MPQRLATSATIAPGCVASATIRHFCSSDQLRRRSPRVTTSTTSLRALMCAVVWVLAASTSTSMSASVLNGSATRPQRRGVSLDGAATTRTIDRVVVTNADVEIRYALPTSPGSEQVRFGHLRKDYFHAPTPAVQLRNLPRRDPLGQVAPQPDHALTCLGRRVQGELDAPPWLARPGQLDPLLTHRSGVGAAAVAPGSFCRHLGVATMLADEEAGLRRLPAQQDRARAELPIRHPKLPRLRAVQQGADRRALALVRVLAGHDVRDQPAVGVVHHQRVSRQRRPAVIAQGR